MNQINRDTLNGHHAAHVFARQFVAFYHAYIKHHPIDQHAKILGKVASDKLEKFIFHMERSLRIAGNQEGIEISDDHGAEQGDAFLQLVKLPWFSIIFFAKIMKAIGDANLDDRELNLFGSTISGVFNLMIDNNFTEETAEKVIASTELYFKTQIK